jgi:hypothetical protein
LTDAPPLRAPKVRAGCGRERAAPDASATEWAYTDLAFPECPACPHRVTPEGGPPFCVWRPVDAPHPFAALGGFVVAD